MEERSDSSPFRRSVRKRGSSSIGSRKMFSSSNDVNDHDRRKRSRESTEKEISKSAKKVQRKVRLSTNADHMENALVNDYTEAFTTDTLFNSREALVDWVREVGKEKGFMIVIKASEAGGGKNKRRPRVRFACERSGKYRKFVKKSIPVEEVKQRPDHTSTKKCGCPFELKAVCDHEGWTLTVVNGMHNHLPARNLEGRSYAGRLSSEEATILVEMSKSLCRPRDILNSLKNRDPTNVSTIKSIYNARQKYRAIERAGKTTTRRPKEEVRREPKIAPTLFEHPLVSKFPIGLRQYIGVKNVEADGNCGFRAIAGLMGFGEDWRQVRTDLIEELNSYEDEYAKLFVEDGRVKELYNTLSYFEAGRVDSSRWMTLPDMGHLIASRYNVVFVFISTRQCLTFLPLRSPPASSFDRKIIAIGLVRDCHFVEVFLKPASPLPPIACKWYKHRHPCAHGWETPFVVQIQLFKQLVGNDTATVEDVIEL